jgi:hypothetical protein
MSPSTTSAITTAKLNCCARLRASWPVRTHWAAHSPLPATRDWNPWQRADGGGEEFGHVLGMRGREMLDLMAATGAGGHDNRAGRLALDLFDKRLGDFQGEFVFLGERAERAGHAAAAGVKHGDARCGRRRASRAMKAGFSQRLGVAMGVDGNVAGLGLKRSASGSRAEQVFDELLEEKTAPATCSVPGRSSSR